MVDGGMGSRMSVWYTRWWSRIAGDDMVDGRIVDGCMGSWMAVSCSGCQHGIADGGTVNGGIVHGGNMVSWLAVWHSGRRYGGCQHRGWWCGIVHAGTVWYGIADGGMVPLVAVWWMAASWMTVRHYDWQYVWYRGWGYGTADIGMIPRIPLP